MVDVAGIVARFIEPASPCQNGVNENFNGRFRDECLNRELIGSVLETQVIARDFRDEYSTIRSHSTLGYRLPPNIATNFTASSGLGEALQAGPIFGPKLGSATTKNHNRNEDH